MSGKGHLRELNKTQSANDDFLVIQFDAYKNKLRK